MRRCQRDLVLRYLAAPELPGGQEALLHVGRIAGAAPGAAALRAVLAALAERKADPGMPAQLRSILGNANSESLLHSLVFQRIQQIIKLEALQEALLQCAPGRLHPVTTERGLPREQQNPQNKLVQAARCTDATAVPHLARSIVAQEQLTKVQLRRAANEELHGSHGCHFDGANPAVLKRRNSNEGETRTLVKKTSLSAFDPLKVSKSNPVDALEPLADVPSGAASITQHADTAKLKWAARLATEKENRETRTLVKKPSLSAFDPLKVCKAKPVEAPTPLAGVPPGAAPRTQHADTAQVKLAARLATEKENLETPPLICFSPKRDHTKAAPTPCFFYSAPR